MKPVHFVKSELKPTMDSDEGSGERSDQQCTNSGQCFVPVPAGNIVSRQSSRPRPPPRLNASCLHEEETTDIARPLNRTKQLQVFLPRTPSSPCPSPFSRPWHGRQGDGSSSSSSSSPASSKSSPASNKSSPGSAAPGSLIDQIVSESKASSAPVVNNEQSLHRLTRRHTYPFFDSSDKASTSPEDRPKQDPEVIRASSLEESVTLQQPEMAAYYLSNGSDPNGGMDTKVSPLIIAASAGNEKIVKMLLAAGANIDLEDDTKGTALHHAAAGGHRGVLKLLLVAGANMFRKTYEGHLAVQLTNDSRIRHLLTCRMRSSSESKVEFESAKNNTVLSQNEATPRSSKPIPRLPRSEYGCVQRVSPPRESPKNIMRVMEQRKHKPDTETAPHREESSVEDAGKGEEFAQKASITSLSSNAESSTRSQSEKKEEKDGNNGRPRRKSVQFIDEVKATQPVETPACKSCGKTDCGGKCEEQTADNSKQTSSKSQGVAEKPFPKPEARTTGIFKWTKGELLGEGAYGKVFSGLNQSTGELMAVKQLKIDQGDGQEKAYYLAALEREIDLYKKLRHKHIVGYINMEQDDKSDSLYIFLEYVSGGSIQSMLERFGRFSEPLVRVYTRQLLLGLQYLHENKIVHRDIKGGNVLVDALGVVKLADFGASKAFHDPTVTNECKSIRGSVFWMAPEVIKGDGYGRRADIWSVGCTVIEMLTAMHPWPDIDNTWSAIFHIAKASSGPPFPEWGSDCVKDFLQQCFQLDPRSRPTATQLLEHRFVGVNA